MRPSGNLQLLPSIKWNLSYHFVLPSPANTITQDNRVVDLQHNPVWSLRNNLAFSRQCDLLVTFSSFFPLNEILLTTLFSPPNIVTQDNLVVDLLSNPVYSLHNDPAFSRARSHLNSLRNNHRNNLLQNLQNYLVSNPAASLPVISDMHFSWFHTILNYMWLFVLLVLLRHTLIDW